MDKNNIIVFADKKLDRSIKEAEHIADITISVYQDKNDYIYTETDYPNCLEYRLILDCLSQTLVQIHKDLISHDSK